MMPKTKRIFRLIFIGLLGSYLIFAFTRMFRAEHLEFLPTHVPKYTSMFFSQKANRVSSNGSYLSKNRHPVSNYDIDGKYDLVVYQINLAKDQSLKTLISAKNEKSNMTGNLVYSDINESLYEISLAEGKPLNAEKITIAYQADRFDATIVNDTIAYYNLNFKQMSFKYQNKTKVDLFVKTKDAGFAENFKPLSMLFLKRQKHLYLFLLSPKLEKTTMDENMLFNLVNGTKD